MSTAPSDPDPSYPDDTAGAPSGLPPAASKPERLLIERFRVWTDVMPPLRLFRVLRLLGSPVWFLVTLVWLLIWQAGYVHLVGETSPADAMVEWSSATGATLIDLPWTVQASYRLPTDLITQHRHPGWGAGLWTIAWMLPLWLSVLRIGALLTAGKDMPSCTQTGRLVLRRLPRALLILLVPTALALTLMLAVWIANGASGLLFGSQDQLDHWWLVPWTVPLTLVASLVVVVGKLAMPLALTHLMTQPHGDVIDSVSRGYEYSLRRAVIAAGLLLLAVPGGLLLLIAASMVTQEAVALSSQFGDTHGAMTARVLSQVPAVILFNFGWSWLGGTFLLLRQSAGGQEVEDCWCEEKPPAVPNLPSVQQQSAG